MSQHDMIIDNAPGAGVRGDINAALQALVSNSSGPVEPTTTYPGQLWLDTTVAPNGALRMRNQANNAWINIPTSLITGTASATTILVNGNPGIIAQPESTTITGSILRVRMPTTSGASSCILRFTDANGVDRGYVQYIFDTEQMSLTCVNAAGTTTQRMTIDAAGVHLTNGAAAGDVLTTGNAVTNANSTTTSFPVGTTLVVANPAAGANNLVRGGEMSPRIDSTNTMMYTFQTTGNPTILAGTWESRGCTQTAPAWYLMQRIA